MSGTTTRLQRLIEQRLDTTLAEFVAERRRVEGPPFTSPIGWRQIAKEIFERTDIEVSNETLRLWYGRTNGQPAVGVPPAGAGEGSPAADPPVPPPAGGSANPSEPAEVR